MLALRACRPTAAAAAAAAAARGRLLRPMSSFKTVEPVVAVVDPLEKALKDIGQIEKELTTTTFAAPALSLVSVVFMSTLGYFVADNMENTIGQHMSSKASQFDHDLLEMRMDRMEPQQDAAIVDLASKQKMLEQQLHKQDACIDQLVLKHNCLARTQDRQDEAIATSRDLFHDAKILAVSAMVTGLGATAVTALMLLVMVQR